MIKCVDDEEKVKEIKEALRNNDGYCPCSPVRTPETKCMCKSFKEQDTGICHCGLYEKV